MWVVDVTDDGYIELIAPNGISLFTVSPDTADMVGRMLIDTVEDMDGEAEDGDTD